MITTDTSVTIYVEEKGMVLKEKALMALDAGSGKILAFGAEAERMAGNPTENVRIVAPLAEGKVADYKTAVKLLLCLLHKAGVKGILFHKPQIALSVPAGLADVEKKALEEALYQAGAGKVLLSETGVDQLPSKASWTIVGITKEE